MARLDHRRRLAAALSLGLALAVPIPARAQRGDATLSSGSGRGTGTGTGAGMGTGAAQPGTGEMTGPGSLRPGMGDMGPRPNMGPAGPLRREGGAGGGAQGNLPAPLRPLPSNLERPPYEESARAPDSGLVVPLGDLMDAKGLNLDPAKLDAIDAQMLPRARAIPDPMSRSLALERVGRSMVLNREYRTAYYALDEAGRAALEMPPGLVRDLRILGIVRTMDALAEEEVRSEGVAEDTTGDELVGEAAAAPTSRRTPAQRKQWLDAAQSQWYRAAELAASMDNRNYRSETLYQVAESQSNTSQLMASAATKAESSRAEVDGLAGMYRDQADRALVWSDEAARRIGQPVWRDRALLTIVISAVASDQFARGLEIARGIPHPSFRTDALVRIAEAQARRGRPADAGRSFQEAARAVASIPEADPRGIFAGILINSLVAVGRFDDARASVPLIADTQQQVLTLGAIARAQGERGFPDSARAWIERDVPVAYRSFLYHRVNEGLANAVDEVRLRIKSNRGQ